MPWISNFRIVILYCVFVLASCLSPRFLVDTYNFCYAVPVCSLQCPNGFVKSPLGCLLCKCEQAVLLLDKSSTAAPPVKTLGPRVYLRRPCNPAVRYCNMGCQFGFKTMAGGCEVCACAPSPTSGPVDTSTMASSAAISTTMTSSTLTTVVVTTSTSKGGYFDPCIPSQPTCKKNCPDGYVKGPQGCQYCFCYSRALVSPMTPSTKPSIPNTTDVAVTFVTSPEVCRIAWGICQTKCSDGFLNKAENCLHCTCDKHEEISDFLVRLPKPCVPGIDKCRTRCMSGYLLGQNGCQYCSCK